MFLFFYFLVFLSRGLKIECATTVTRADATHKSRRGVHTEELNKGARFQDERPFSFFKLFFFSGILVNIPHGCTTWPHVSVRRPDAAFHFTRLFPFFFR
uniref:Secreted protein n=1 Tax=Anguilla anguilla TaxID=7936 RepID=A0A0E9WRM8_ANGAN